MSWHDDARANRLRTSIVGGIPRSTEHVPTGSVLREVADLIGSPLGCGGSEDLPQPVRLSAVEPGTEPIPA